MCWYTRIVLTQIYRLHSAKLLCACFFKKFKKTFPFFQKLFLGCVFQPDHTDMRATWPRIWIFTRVQVLAYFSPCRLRFVYSQNLLLVLFLFVCSCLFLLPFSLPLPLCLTLLVWCSCLCVWVGARAHVRVSLRARVKEREKARARVSVCSKVREIRSHDGHCTNTKAVYVRLTAMRVLFTCVRAYLRYTFVGVDVAAWTGVDVSRNKRDCTERHTVWLSRISFFLSRTKSQGTHPGSEISFGRLHTGMRVCVFGCVCISIFHICMHRSKRRTHAANSRPEPSPAHTAEDSSAPLLTL